MLLSMLSLVTLLLSVVKSRGGKVGIRSDCIGKLSLVSLLVDWFEGLEGVTFASSLLLGLVVDAD